MACCLPVIATKSGGIPEAVLDNNSGFLVSEKDPISEIQLIYKYFDVEFSNEFEKQISEFLNSVKEYQKNKYTMPEGDKLGISNILKSWMKDKNYNL